MMDVEYKHEGSDHDDQIDLAHDDHDAGEDEADNVEYFGPNGNAATAAKARPAKPAFSFKPKEHFETGEALGMMDFEAAAKKTLPPAHWGYLSTGVDDDATLKANRAGFGHYQLRSRRLVDTTKIDMSIDLYGTKWETPIVLAPSGTLFHPEGPLPVARAAQKQKTLQSLMKEVKS